MAQTDTAQPARRMCLSCGDHGTVWNPKRRTGWPRSVPCTDCDSWTRWQATKAAAAPVLAGEA